MANPFTGRAFSAVLTAAIVALSAAPLFAQNGQSRDVALQTGDAWHIFVTYFESSLGENAPVLVLLPMEKSNRLIWKDFATQANKEGYAVITVDPRRFGQSRAPGGVQGGDGNLRGADFLGVVTQDLEAVKQFIFEQHQEKKLNMRKLGIVGAGETATIAIGYGLFDWAKPPYPDAAAIQARTPRGQDVRALVLLSPATDVPGINVGQSLNALRTPEWGVSFLVGYAANDAADAERSRKIYEKVAAPRGNKDRVYIQDYNGSLRGTAMLGKDLGVEKHMLTFLDRHLKSLPEPWRDRQSLLNK